MNRELQAARTKKQVEQQLNKAMEEDPNAFAYDEVCVCVCVCVCG